MWKCSRKKLKLTPIAFLTFFFFSAFGSFFFLLDKPSAHSLISNSTPTSSFNSLTFSHFASSSTVSQTSSPPNLPDSQPKKGIFYYTWIWTSNIFKWTSFGISNLALLIVQPLTFLFKGAWFGLGFLGSFLAKIFYKPVAALVFSTSSK